MSSSLKKLAKVTNIVTISGCGLFRFASSSKSSTVRLPFAWTSLSLREDREDYCSLCCYTSEALALAMSKSLIKFSLLDEKLDCIKVEFSVARVAGVNPT